MTTEKKWTVYPLVYFNADFPENIYENYDLDIKLIKAEVPDLNRDKYSELFSCNNFDFILELCRYTMWFVSVHLSEAVEHLSPHELGMSFKDCVEKTILDSFLLCLQLVRPSLVQCPYSFALDNCNYPLNIAELLDTEVEGYNGTDYFEGYTINKSSYFNDTKYDIDDITILKELWSAICQLRQLEQWSSIPFTESFFAELDRTATVNAKAAFQSFLKSRDETWRSRGEPWRREFAEEFWKGDSDFRDAYYRDSFKEAFVKKEEEMLLSRTRIGRALSLYNEGVKLPKLHAFLSMCLVLETLFTVGQGEVMHKLATRYAKIMAKDDSENRKDLYKKVKKVYTERSHVVHGSKLIEAVDTEVWSDAFDLARLALENIMLDNEILTLYSDPDTCDIKTGEKKRTEKVPEGKSLEDYFLDLDLGTL